MTVVLAVPGRDFTGPFVDSLVGLVGHFMTKGVEFVFSRRYSPMLPFVRNLCLGGDVLRGKGQKPFGGKLKFDYVVWVDSDIVFSPSQMQSLLDLREDFTTGFYLMENGMEFAAVKDASREYFLKNGRFRFMSPPDLNGPRRLVELDYCGLGFCAMSRKMLWDLEYPWFRTRFEDMGNDVRDESMEDFAFCRAVQAKGYRIWGDTSVVVGHVKSKVLIPENLRAGS